ncbi:MAG: transporter [Alphaproteobacteria bacterium]
MRCLASRALTSLAAGSVLLLVLLRPALAGPPYVTDDPAPTDYKHFEIFLYTSGTHTRDETSTESGIELNYGAAPDLQLAVTLPVVYESPRDEETAAGVGNIELSFKYRFLHSSEIGWDVAVYPQITLPSGSSKVGDRPGSIFFPVWLGRDWGKWSTFGGGGCAINRGGGSQDFCLASWALTRQFLPNLQLGAEIVHQTADTKDGRATTGVGAGLIYDLSENYHLLAYAGPGVQNAAETNQYSWYASILFTF